MSTASVLEYFAKVPDPRSPNPEVQPLTPPGIGSCTEVVAIDLGAPHVLNTVPGDACLRVTQYPGQWVGAVVLQMQDNAQGAHVVAVWREAGARDDALELVVQHQDRGGRRRVGAGGEQ